MSRTKRKYYAVKAGRKTGIFQTWGECKKQVDGYSRAIFKSFSTMEKAEEYLHGKGKTQNTLKNDRTEETKSKKVSKRKSLKRNKTWRKNGQEEKLKMILLFGRN